MRRLLLAYLLTLITLLSSAHAQFVPGSGGDFVPANLPFIYPAVVCDNSTDNTTPITAAIATAAAAGRGTVVFPAGLCKYFGPINVPTGVYISGAGKAATVLTNSNASGIGFTFSGTSNAARSSFVGASNLTFNCNGQTATAVQSKWSDHVLFQNVRFFNCNGPGLRLTNSYDDSLIATDFDFTGSSSVGATASLICESDATDSCNNILIFGSRFESFPGGAVYISDAGSGHIPYAISIVGKPKMESNVWQGATLGVAMIDGSGSVDEVRIENLFAHATLAGGGTPGTILHFFGRNSWQVSGIDTAVDSTGQVDKVVNVDPSGNDGHSLRGVQVNSPNSGIGTAIVSFAGSAPSDPLNPMRIGNVGSYAGITGNVTYAGATPQGVILDDLASVRSVPKSAGFTFALTDGTFGAVDDVTSGSGVNAQIPTNASVAFPIGQSLTACQQGAGVVTITAAGGVTLTGTVATTALGQCLTARQISANTWVSG